MGLFFTTNKNITVTFVGSSQALQLDTPITLPFYIVEAVQDTEITAIDYRIIKADGRNAPIEVQSWVAITLVPEDVYEMDVTISGETIGTSVDLQFKVVDIDNLESFVTVPAFKVVA